MRDYKQEEWFKREVKNYIDEYTDVPPPWVYDPESHPYSMQWRMGGGETFIMVLGAWLEDELITETERVSYLKKYPPPPRWLAWAADFIWDLKLEETQDFEYTPYLEKLKNLGFEGTSEYQQDLDDEKWFKRNQGGDDLQDEFDKEEGSLWRLITKSMLALLNLRMIVTISLAFIVIILAAIFDNSKRKIEYENLLGAGVILFCVLLVAGVLWKKKKINRQ